MIAPVDYTLNVPSPVDRMQQGLSFGQGMRANEQAMQIATNQDQRAQATFDNQQTVFAQGQAAAQDQREKAAKLQGDLAGLSAKVADGTATFADFAGISLAHPDLAAQLKTVWDGQSEERKKNDIAGLYRAGAAIKSGKPELAIKALEDYATAAENAGQKMDADMARATAGIIKANPSAGLTQIGMLLHGVDEDAAKALFGDAETGKQVQSNVTLDDGTTIVTFDDGTKQVSDAAGTVISGQAAIDAVKAAQAYGAEVRKSREAGATAGRLETTVDLGGAAAGAVEAGKQAVAKSGEAYDALGKVNANISTIDTAIEALDAGANAGAIARYFPNVSAASASLENAMNRLGLDVISSVTFGALSEGEMKLAMETAVPRNLDEKALRQWLTDKKAAQQKASDALYEAAVYLGTPGNTLEGWLKEHPRGSSKAASGKDATTSASGSGSQTKSTVIDGYTIEESP